jgi:hypothetical protein
MFDTLFLYSLVFFLRFLNIFYVLRYFRLSVFLNAFSTKLFSMLKYNNMTEYQSKKNAIIHNSTGYANDRQLGLSSELKLIEFLNKENEDPFIKYENRFSLFDIYNSTTIAEIKTRRNRYMKYPSTMVGYNKVKVAEKDPSKLYRFYFIFTDGTYYWDYKEGDYEIRKAGRKDRGVGEYKDYCFIPINKLFLLSTAVQSVS